MSQSGVLVFYRTEPLEDPVGLLSRLVEAINPVQIIIVSRTRAAAPAWNDFVESQDHVPTEMLPSPIEPKDWVKYYREPYRLSGEFSGTAMGKRIMEAVEAGIPQGVRNNFLPSDLIVWAGEHLLWEDAENEEGVLIARPYLSVKFFGYGTPLDWKAFRREVFVLPGVQEAKRELEAILGPLQECVYWSV
jgi:hypothetical protein